MNEVCIEDTESNERETKRIKTMLKENNAKKCINDFVDGMNKNKTKDKIDKTKDKINKTKDKLDKMVISIIH